MVRGCLCGHPKKTPGSGGGGAASSSQDPSNGGTSFPPGCSAGAGLLGIRSAMPAMLKPKSFSALVGRLCAHSGRTTIASSHGGSAAKPLLQSWSSQGAAVATCVSRPRCRDLWLVASPCILALASAAAAYPDFAGSTPTSTAWASKQGVSTRTSRCRSGQSEGPRS
jgi:hypothetical protein